jgi:hypothetical protein
VCNVVDFVAFISLLSVARENEDQACDDLTSFVLLFCSMSFKNVLLCTCAILDCKGHGCSCC